MICYENRNGLVRAFDTESKLLVVPRGLPNWDSEPTEEPFTDSEGLERNVDRGPNDRRYRPAFDACSPEQMHAELIRRGVKSVWVYTGNSPSWINGQVQGEANRISKFAHVASQFLRKAKAWTEAPIGRMVDGTDWSDIYHNRGQHT